MKSVLLLPYNHAINPRKKIHTIGNATVSKIKNSVSSDEGGLEGGLEEEMGHSPTCWNTKDAFVM